MAWTIPFLSGQLSVKTNSFDITLIDSALKNGIDFNCNIAGQCVTSHGCARMYNSQVLWLYARVPIGTYVHNLR